jgi:hypothetical protein
MTIKENSYISGKPVPGFEPGTDGFSMQSTAPDSAILTGEYVEAQVGEILQTTSDKNQELNEWQTNIFVKMCLKTTPIQYSQYSVGSHTRACLYRYMYININIYIYQSFVECLTTKHQ